MKAKFLKCYQLYGIIINWFYADSLFGLLDRGCLWSREDEWGACLYLTYTADKKGSLKGATVSDTRLDKWWSQRVIVTTVRKFIRRGRFGHYDAKMFYLKYFKTQFLIFWSTSSHLESYTSYCILANSLRLQNLLGWKEIREMLLFPRFCLIFSWNFAALKVWAKFRLNSTT